MDNGQTDIEAQVSPIYLGRQTRAPQLQHESTFPLLQSMDVSQMTVLVSTNKHCVSQLRLARAIIVGAVL
jgi:hypothetical protein